MSDDRRSWRPHLWVFVPPIAAVVIGYSLWELMMVILQLPNLPPWISQLLHRHR